MRSEKILSSVEGAKKMLDVNSHSIEALDAELSAARKDRYYKDVARVF